MAVLVPLAVVLERDAWSLGPAFATILLLSLVSVAASLFLYRAFEYGVLSVVSPLASSYPAITAGLAFLFLGERPGALVYAGIVAILAGILLLSRSEAHPDNPPARDARAGLVSAFLAFLGYGVFYFAIDYVVTDLGPVTSAAIVRVVAVGVLLLAAAPGLARLRMPDASLRPLLVTVGLLDSGAFLAYNFGILGGSVAVVGTLSGLFSAVTIGLAAAVLRERLTAAQYAGVAAIFAGVVLLAFG